MIDYQEASNWTINALKRSVAGGLRSGPPRELPRLADVHPGSPTGGRWIGVRTVPTDSIRGTASMSGSRGADFRPLGGHEPADWKSRWSRLMSASRALAILPPVQLLRVRGEHWVVDGHNRVALARQVGQLWIDGDITELDLGSHSAATAAKEN